MTRLRIQFAFFAFFLAVVFGAGLYYTQRRLDAEERILWERTAENAFNQMQAVISEHLVTEDRRSFSEYRYYFVPEGQATSTKNLIVSPLAKLPGDDDRGLIGYFQIDPDGSFHTPYLPPGGKSLMDTALRRTLQERLKALTRSLQKNAHDDYRGRAEEDRRRAGAESRKDSSDDKSQKTVELAATPQGIDVQQDSDGSEQKIYPNPLREKSEEKKKNKKNKKGRGSAPTQDMASNTTSSEGVSKAKKQTGFSREIRNDPVQSKAFEEQNATSNENAIVSESQSSIFIDPFRARLVGDKTLVFYRKIWLGQRLYLQGFAVDLTDYISAALGHSFDNTDMTGFAEGRLMLDDVVLLSWGEDIGDPILVGQVVDFNEAVFFRRYLGYPLNLFEWRLAAGLFPPSSARSAVNRFAMVAGILLLAGLYSIYRGTRATVMLSRKRQDFVSAVTHELRTPLTAIRMYGEMLEQGWVKDEAKRTEYFGNINREGARLSRLIENVLHLSSLEKGTFRIHPVTAEPRHDFLQIASELTPLAARAGFVLSSRVGDDIGLAFYDAEVLQQIFFTLLDNSLKFARDSTPREIELSLERTGDKIIWTLADHGPGVPAAELPRIFDTFYRVESEMTRTTKGSGIGLGMARMMTQAMGGSIEAKNRSGGGLEVRVSVKSWTPLSH